MSTEDATVPWALPDAEWVRKVHLAMNLTVDKPAILQWVCGGLMNCAWLVAEPSDRRLGDGMGVCEGGE